MRTFTTLTLFVLLFSNSAFCQNPTYEFAEFIDKSVIDDEPDTPRFYVSPPAVNIFFNNQMSRYLSGSEDLVMNKTYAVLNSADKELTLGGTFTRKKKKREFVRSMMQVGVKLKTDDDFAEIFNAEDGLAASAGLFWKGTLFSRGFVNFGNDIIVEELTLEDDKPSKEKKTPEEAIATVQSHEKYLELVYQKKLAEKINEVNTLTTFYADEYGLTDEAKEEKINKEKEKVLEELRAEYMEEVQKYLLDSKLYKGTHKFWASVDVFIPITPTEYVTAASTTTLEFDTIQLRPFSFKVFGSYLGTKRNGVRYFASISSGFEVHNTITRDERKKTSFRTLIERDVSNPDIELTEISNNEVYVGEVDEQIIVPSIEFNGSVMFGGSWSFTGLSTSVEYRLDPDNSAWFLKGGIPFSLAGKDDKARVNFEPLVKWNTNNENLVVGVSVGLPLGKSMY